MAADLGPELEGMLRALDTGAQTVEDLAHRLGKDEATVQELLADGADRGLVAFWDPVYVTTWRAKTVLHPVFFRSAVPASAAVGAAVTGFFVALRADAAAAALAAWAGALVLAALSWHARRAGHARPKT